MFVVHGNGPSPSQTLSELSTAFTSCSEPARKSWGGFLKGISSSSVLYWKVGDSCQKVSSQAFSRDFTILFPWSHSAQESWIPALQNQTLFKEEQMAFCHFPQASLAYRAGAPQARKMSGNALPGRCRHWPVGTSGLVGTALVAVSHAWPVAGIPGLCPSWVSPCLICSVH